MNLTVGQTATRQLTVTEEIVRSYAEITGDYNPLHFDPEFVARTRFERLLAQGGIATGLLHALVAMDMPGPGSLFMRQNWSFPRPVYIGDSITAHATVKSVREHRSIAEIEFTVANQQGQTVLEGAATVYRATPES